MDCRGFDEQVVRLDKGIADLAKQFVLVRITNMRGVDLNTFDFDYDLTWAGLFMNADGYTYSRFGGRDAGPAEKHLTIPALKYAMQRALAAYKHDPNARPSKPAETRTPESYPMGARIKPDACIHCHQIHPMMRDVLKRESKWSNELAYRYPVPETVGITVDDDQPDHVKAVAAGSQAARAGIKAGDVLARLNGMPVASYLDVLMALDRAPVSGAITVQTASGTHELALPEGWRRCDISWRASMWGLEPSAGVYGKDLTADEKRAIGLAPDALAFTMGDYVPGPTARAGIHAKDIILAIEGKEMKQTMLQFNLYVRMNYKPGDQITYLILRNGQRLRIPFTLPKTDG